MRDVKASTGLAAYWIVGEGLAKRRAACPYFVNLARTVAENGGPASPDCDAEAIPQSGGMVPRGYAAKA